MGRPRKTPATVTIKPTVAEVLDEERDQAATEDSILGALDSIPDGANFQIIVYQLEKKTPNGHPEATWLFECARDDVPTLWETLRDSYGSGTYRVNVRRSTGLGAQSVLVKSITRNVKSLKPLGAPVTPAAAPAAPDIAAAVVAAMAPTLQGIAAIFERMVQAPAAPPPDPFAMMEKVAGLMKTMQPPPPAAPATPASDPMEYFTRGIEFAKSFGSSEREEGAMGLLGDLVKSPAVEKLVEMVMTRPAAAPAAPAIAATPLAPPQPAQTPNQEMVMVKMAVDKICHFATQGADVTVAADWCFDNLPPPLVDQIAIIGDADIVQQIMQAFPYAQPHRGYFAALQREIAASITDADGAAADTSNSNEPPARPGGGAGNDEGHAPPSAPGEAG